MPNEKETKDTLGPRKSKTFKVDHNLVGQDVSFQGYVWKVISAYRNQPGLEPWLTLRRGLVEATAKSYEVEPIYN